MYLNNLSIQNILLRASDPKADVRVIGLAGYTGCGCLRETGMPPVFGKELY